MAFNDKFVYCPKCGREYLHAEGMEKRVTCKCGEKVVHTNITAEEQWLISRTSSDHDFFLAMIELKEKDIIEFQSRIAQYRAQAKAEGCYSKPKHDNAPKCPKCGSTHITTGARGVSCFWGFIGTGKTVNRCSNCGNTWKPRG